MQRRISIVIVKLAPAAFEFEYVETRVIYLRRDFYIAYTFL